MTNPADHSLRASQPTLFEQSRPQRRGARPPEPDSSRPQTADCIGENDLRPEPCSLPELSEASVVRHYTRLSSEHVDRHELLPSRLLHDEVQPENQ